MSVTICRATTAALLIAVAASSSYAQWPAGKAPDSLSIQGRLTNLGGTPIDGAVPMTFKLYKGANVVFTQSIGSVMVSDGIFSAHIGGVKLDTVTFNDRIDLGVTVDTDPEMTPRVELQSSAYARAIPGMFSFYSKSGSLASISVIGGAPNNRILNLSVGSAIGGGGGLSTEGPSLANTIDGDFSTISGGFSNSINGSSATIGGGEYNQALGSQATVGGGSQNRATGIIAAVTGGYQNRASGAWSSVGGGSNNRATIDYATVPGGFQNQARGKYSFAAGYKARAKHDGTFVWNDRSVTSGDDSLLSTGSNQFLIRAVGGVGVGTNAPNTLLSVNGAADIATGLAVGKATPGTTLDVQGGLWDLSVSEGDIRIGSSTNRLKIGVATDGGGRGIARINAVGLVPRVVLGTSNNDIVVVSPTSFAPWTDNATELGNGSQHWTTVYATNGTISSSDRRLKEDIRPIGYGLMEVMQLKPVNYKWKSRPLDGDKLGLIAQDVDAVIPEVVHRGVTEEEMLGLNYSDLVPVLIRAVQEQQETIASLERRVKVLEGYSTK